MELLRPTKDENQGVVEKTSQEGIMKVRTWKTVGVGALLSVAGAISILHAQQSAPDLILANGKIITVDDRFTIAQGQPDPILPA
jgi:hypothetical protein